eukprot:EC824475.1.p1 GENE.EC824475.1~~EC824475.1.p1  ORF type:complete len:151 (+),score=56.57 EC824475.1:117-569(+)
MEKFMNKFSTKIIKTKKIIKKRNNYSPTRKELAKYFNLTIDEASKKLNLSVSKIYSLLKKYKIKGWPTKKKSMFFDEDELNDIKKEDYSSGSEKQIDSIEEQDDFDIEEKTEKENNKKDNEDLKTEPDKNKIGTENKKTGNENIKIEKKN